jgi:hypothetical protein
VLALVCFDFYCLYYWFRAEGMPSRRSPRIPEVRAWAVGHGRARRWSSTTSEERPHPTHWTFGSARLQQLYFQGGGFTKIDDFATLLATNWEWAPCTCVCVSTHMYIYIYLVVWNNSHTLLASCFLNVAISLFPQCCFLISLFRRCFLLRCFNVVSCFVVSTLIPDLVVWTLFPPVVVSTRHELPTRVGKPPPCGHGLVRLRCFNVVCCFVVSKLFAGFVVSMLFPNLVVSTFLPASLF